MNASRSKLANAAHAAMLQRGELRRSLTRIKSAFKPVSLKDRGKFHAKETASDVAQFARDEVSNKSVMIGIAALLGLAWLFRNPIQKKSPQWAKSFGRRAANFAATINHGLDPSAAASEVKEKAKMAVAKKKREAAHIVDDFSNRAADETQHQLSEAMDKFVQAMNGVSKFWPAASAAGLTLTKKVNNMKPLGQTARDARDKAGELAETAAENARQTAEAAKARVQDGYGRAREVGADLAEKGREQAGVAKEAAGAALVKGKEQAQIAGSRLREYAKEQPITLLVGAIAIGVVIGALLLRDDDA